MFKNKKKKIDPNMTDTLIGEGTTFEGKISSQAGIRVEGQMIGNIECEGDITVGENGIARSDIRSRNLVIAGQVIGNVAAAGKLIIKATGKLHGNLSAQELSIESGGIFHGTSSMNLKESSIVEDRISPREAELTLPIAQEEEKAAAYKAW